MREFHLNGYIDDDVWFGDEITPAVLHDKLYPEDIDTPDDVRIVLNSYGGSCNAATQMYDEIKAYPGHVHMVISGTAASAATVLSMAADRVEITPGSLYMVHDPIIAAYGNEADLEAAQDILRACKNSIINIYRTRSYHSRDELGAMMTATTWMDAEQALHEGFVDGVLTDTDCGVINSAFLRTADIDTAKAKYAEWLDRRRPVSRSVRNETTPEPTVEQTEEPRTPASDLEQRLDKLKYNY